MTGVTFSATLNRITTTIDGGWRVSFDVPQSDKDQMIELSGLRDSTLQVGIVDQNGYGRDIEISEEGKVCRK